MELSLAKNLEVGFENVPTQNAESYRFVSIRGKDVNIWPNLNKIEELNEFTGLLQRHELENQQIRNARAEIEFGVILSEGEGNVANNNRNGFFSIQDKQMSGTLETLSNLCGTKLNLRAEITKIYKGQNKVQSVLTFCAAGVVLKNETTEMYGMRVENLDIQNEFFKLYNATAIRGHGTLFFGCASITVYVENSIMPSFENNVGDDYLIPKKMLNEEIACDVTIIPGNGVAVNCHKGFLVAHSPVMATMFKTSMTESKTNILEIPDMTEEAVRSLLAYLYYWDVQKAAENPSICFELFHAAHKYDIPKLEMAMRQILLRKQVEWFEVEMAMKLFLLARNLEDGAALKQKAVRALKANHTL